MELATDNIKGNITSVKTVAMAIPYEIDIAIGFKNCACLLFSKSNGAKPATVVNVVNSTGTTISASSPITWATNDAFVVDLAYEI